MIEIVLVILYILNFKVYGLTLEFFLYSFVFSILILASVIDIEHMIVPNRISLMITFSFFITTIIEYYSNGKVKLIDNVLGAIIGGGFYLLIAIVTKGGMGGGDIKLMASLGFLLGIEKTILTILITFILGGAISVILILSKRKNRKDKIPFVPFISMAFFTVILFRSNILIFYI